MGDTTAVAHKDSDGASIRNSTSIIELDTALQEILHVQDDGQEGAQNHVPASESTLICLQKVEMCTVLNIHQGSDCCTKPLAGLTKSATFPSPGVTLPSVLEDRSDALDTALHGQSSLKYENPSYTRSISMPAPVKLVSAMKGGHEQHGTRWLEKMNVTWAPDVFDPPASSLSHTVKSHQYQPPKAKKRKDQKKRRRGKSARCSSNEKQHQDDRSIARGVHMQSRSQTSRSRSVPLDDFDRPTEAISSNAASSNRSVLLGGFDEQSQA